MVSLGQPVMRGDWRNRQNDVNSMEGVFPDWTGRRRDTPLASGRPGATTTAKSEVFDIYTIIFLALAVFIFIRLRSVLGQRTGRERPPYDPYSRRDATKAPVGSESGADKIINFPDRNGEQAVPPAPVEPVDESEPAPQRWAGVAEIGSAGANGLDALAAQDRGFYAKHFLAGARAAYENIVVAFA